MTRLHPPPAPSPDPPAGCPVAGRLLGVDWGERRIGLALTDESQLLARPLATLTRRAGKRFPLRPLLALLEEHAAAGVVVGLPLAPDGSEGAAAVAARRVAADIARRSGRPVALWDERFSTARALEAVREMGGSTRGRKAAVDALAAALLLQHYLDARRGSAA
ncbi:MAG TPA: Holliday junction resolvase RuvX [Gemmatimonadales bacterium]|nr:Holliday junction resolvase RuvX [Gemmatimonadales bacterium]